MQGLSSLPVTIEKCSIISGCRGHEIKTCCTDLILIAAVDEVDDLLLLQQLMICSISRDVVRSSSSKTANALLTHHVSAL